MSKIKSGEKFKKLEGKLEKEGVKNPAGLAAKIGREKMGKAKFQEAAEKGKEIAKKKK